MLTLYTKRLDIIGKKCRAANIALKYKEGNERNPGRWVEYML